MSADFYLTRADGERRRIYGYRQAKPAADLKRFSASKLGSKNLPNKVDLRRMLTPVEDQGATNSCTANAVAGAYEYLAKKHLQGDSWDASRLFLYYNARSLDEDMESIEDEGSAICVAISSLQKYGICSEDTWPFQEDEVNEEPSADAYDEAARFLVEDFAIVPTKLQSWKECLAEGMPIIFGIDLFDSFERQRRPGLVPMPTKKEKERDEHASHAMLCVGYSDKDKVFIVRNSWGPDWGDKGYCYIPYDYVINDRYNDGDSWMIRQLDGFDVDQDTWYDDDESLFEDYESELDNMSDDDYDDLLEDLDRIPLETRIALILIHAAWEDDDLSDEEMDEIASYMKDTLEQLGSDLSAKKIIRYAKKQIDEGNEDIVAESIEILGNHLSEGMLATIVSDVEEIAGVDDLDEDEESFIDHLIESWELEAVFYTDDDDDDDSAEEDEEDADDEDDENSEDE
ncbi:MAG: hypothetical protein KDK39_14485 [Leptospiraceae bacterium]|nr:hypothetical protein [Leptospiraceae bacterium]